MSNQALSDEPLLPAPLPVDSGPLRHRAARVTCTLCGRALHDETQRGARVCGDCIDPENVL